MNKTTMSTIRLICRGCLFITNVSNDHNFENYNFLINIYKNLINDEENQLLEDIMVPWMKDVRLGFCPYCTAVLTRVVKFKSRCLKAYNILKTLMCDRKMSVDSLDEVCKRNSSVWSYGVEQVCSISCVEEEGKIKVEVGEEGEEDGGQHSEGFDSEDDRVLTKLNINIKDSSNNVKTKKKTRVKKEKKKKMRSVEKAERCKEEVMVGEELIIKEEEIMEEGAGLWEELLGGRDTPPIREQVAKPLKKRPPRKIYHRLDVSNVELIRQSPREIHAELDRFRASPGYQSAPYKCHPCAKYFMTDISLALHNQRHSESAGPMVCEICTQRYSTPRSLSIHIQTHTDRYKCTYVQPNNITTQENINGDTVNSERKNGGGYVLTNPAYKENTDGETVNSERKNSSGHTPINLALQENSNGMLLNSERKNGDEHFPANPASQKNNSGKTIYSEGKNSCGLIQSNPILQENIGGQIQNCDKKENTNEETILSERNNSDQYNPTNPSFRENSDGNIEHSENKTERQDAVGVGVMCGRIFAARSAAVKHALKHTGEQMVFNCDICGKTTNCHNTHQKHVRSHSVVKKYPCPQCGKEFKNSTTRNLHVMRAHTGVKHFACDSCPMSFVTKTALVAHAIKHSTEREHYCVECDMHFKSASILKCHLTTSTKHSDPNTFKFECNMCQRRYPLLYRLREHIESCHSRGGQCVCDVCGASYHTRANLRRHHRHKHQQTTRERKHRCKLCDKAFLTRQTLSSHQLTHTGERPFPCPLCGRLFRHKAALWTHNKLVHNKTKQ